MSTTDTTPNPNDLSDRLPKSYDPLQVEKEWDARWAAAGHYAAQDADPSRPAFAICIPPPNVTGSLHIGHALTVSIEDALTRWKRMSGFNTLWMPGTDHAGIATQMVVERELKKTENKTRHDLGREEFVKRIWAWKEQYGGRIGLQLRTLGCSVDWKRERFTMDEGLSKAVREVFVQLHEQGLIYRAKRLINWCPRCRTALSDLEVEHEEKNGSLWHIAYPVEGTDVQLVVATTRPETMLGDTAVAVHPEDPRHQAVLGKQVKLPLTGRSIPVIGDAVLVDMAFGSGAVKVTPAHDFNDNETGKRHGLPQISILDLEGKVNAEGGKYAGLDRFEARKQVVADLEALGLLVKVEPHKLSVGTCQRCATVVEPMLSDQWFVKIQPLAEKAIAAVESGETKFVPESWTQTYFGWMRNIHDWCISRQLWWGHQIPAWYGPNGEVVVARERPAGCEGWRQDEDVLDTWFSSALWPFSTLGWPEKTKTLETFYPNSVMETGHDILFFWVARMMMFGIHFMGRAPFKTVYLHAMVRDEQGEKMSKVKGNVVDPLDVIQGQTADKLPLMLKKQYAEGMPAMGADALRFTLVSQTAAGRDIKLSLKRVEGYKAFVNKLWNASRFALMHLGGVDAGGPALSTLKLSLADRWILSRLQVANRDATAALEEFRFNDAASVLYQFVWGELCDWYLELAKGALYGSDAEAKLASQRTLLHVLDATLKLLHPFIPFATEEIWTKLPHAPGAKDSLMVSAWPAVERAFLDEKAEAQLAPVITAITGIRNIRGESGIAFAKKLTVVGHVPDAGLRATLETTGPFLKALAGVDQLSWVAGGDRPAKSAAFVAAGMELFVPLEGLIDFASEIGRLQKEMKKVDADLTLLTNKHANEAFIAKAPKEVLEKDRARMAELNEKKTALTAHLTRLGA